MKEIVSETANNIKLVQMAAEELNRAEMAKSFQTTETAISKRLDRIRQKYGCGTIAGLVYLFYKNNLIK